MTDVDLFHHGDAEADPGLLDVATNVRLAGPPPWLAARLGAALAGIGRYPSTGAARAAVAARHERPADEVTLVAGAAEAFVLLARALTTLRAVCVHPSFTAPEACLRAARHAVERAILPPPFALVPDVIPEEADLVVLGNPTNPTSVAHAPDAVAALARPGRTLVVDEAFADCVPGEAASLARRRDVPGLVVVRSLTKTWGLAGLRVGYVLSDAATAERLAGAQPPWPVSTLAAVATEAVCAPAALAEADAWARALAEERRRLAGALDALPGVAVATNAAASFLLLHVEHGNEVREGLRERGVAVRRGDTFPGLGPDWLRVAVRDGATNLRVVEAFAAVLREREPLR